MFFATASAQHGNASTERVLRPCGTRIDSNRSAGGLV